MHAAVLGDPVAHSLSPLLHTAAYDALGLRGWRYHAVRCAGPDLAGLLARVAASGRWAGLSLTRPLKELAPPLLDQVVTDLGAVNTVVVDGGRLVGHNTDPDGIAAGLSALGFTGGPVAILGAGGTARAALAAVAGTATAVTLHVRSAGRAAGAVAVGERLGLTVAVAGLDAVPPGVTTVSTLPPDVPAVAVDGPLLDVVYAPWPTPTAARIQGHPVVSGREVLLGQAAAQVALMTGRPAPLAALRAALA
ncbi:MAG TPA: shikimate dehydrogenase [Mycobacteriales bacterium]